MILLLLGFVFVVTLIFAVIADKKKAKFFFGMRPDESILSTVDSVNYYTEGKLVATTGMLYLTDLRLIYFQYKYKFIGFLPFIGPYLEAIFIDTNSVFDISIKSILFYHEKKTRYVKQYSKLTIDCFCDATITMKDKQEYKLKIPMRIDEYDAEKPAILMHLDLLLLENSI